MSFPMEALPRIACFHGGGSTGAIFEMQCEQVRDQFASTFELVFFDAPFYRDAGPGVLPFFVPEKWGPYRTWFKGNILLGTENGDGRDVDGKGEGGIERVLRLIADKGWGGDWVGCMGFSQGSRIVGGLLLDQQRRKELGLPKAEGDIDFQFGVLCMGAGPPMVSDISYMAEDDGVINTPTFHLHGTKDAQYENGKKQMKTYYDPNSVKSMDIDYHHAMPWHRADLVKFCDAVRQIYKDTKPKLER
ncbi:uncharacterized protein LY89DRAFT_732362 [Mollisia scopiformis]|uniref:Serine hydrolase domain-containing protein n=1 Tax=Mollisia scopiformis TaxID=149040 RepID=A0A194XF45_MOLSC|nr:uncharacterized protein LY89DRAFT_732362 [Mollisia scopiformis]KUJ18815.1 hypothetical protein LY89DRAFT_732362 [Mollisia scopiformis]